MIGRENLNKVFNRRVREQFGWLSTTDPMYSHQTRNAANIEVINKYPSITFVIQDFDPNSPTFGEFLPLADLGPADSFPAP